MFFQRRQSNKENATNPLCATGLVSCCGRPCLGSLAVLGLDGSASSCSLERGAWSATKRAKRPTLLFAKTSVLLQCANTFQNASLYNSQRLAQCNVRVRTRRLGASPSPQSSDGAACGPVSRWALCSAGRSSLNAAQYLYKNDKPKVRAHLQASQSPL